MMKTYRIDDDANNMQSIQPTKEKDSAFYRFDCTERASTWEETEVYIYNPLQDPKDFFGMTPGVLIFNEMVLDICRNVFEKAGELLPLRVERGGPKLYILNILDCRNVLDYDRTIWDYYSDGKKGRILNFAFHKDRLRNESTLFKIPESSVGIFCYTDDRNEDDQFYHLYHKHELTGLTFEEIDNE
jgi:hypothetical protein